MALSSEYNRKYRHECGTPCHIYTAGVEDVPDVFSPNSYMDVDEEDDLHLDQLFEVESNAAAGDEAPGSPGGDASGSSDQAQLEVGEPNVLRDPEQPSQGARSQSGEGSSVADSAARAPSGGSATEADNQSKKKRRKSNRKRYRPYAITVSKST